MLTVPVSQTDMIWTQMLLAELVLQTQILSDMVYGADVTGRYGLESRQMLLSELVLQTQAAVGPGTTCWCHRQV